MVVILGLFTITGIFTTARVKPLVLFPAYFKTFLAPKPVNPFEVDYPVSFPQLDSYPSIAISWMLEVQFQQILDNRLIFIRLFRLISLGTSCLV